MGDRINMNDILYPGNDRTSPSGEYQLIFQDDSNLVLYKRNGDDTQVIWSTNTYSDQGSTNHSVLLQQDGNWVVYNADGQALWATETSYDARSPYIQVQDDGNLVLYDEDGVHWASNTQQ